MNAFHLSESKFMTKHCIIQFEIVKSIVRRYEKPNRWPLCLFVLSNQPRQETQQKDDQVEYRSGNAVDSGQDDRQKGCDGRCCEGGCYCRRAGEEIDADRYAEQTEVVKQDIPRFGAQLVNVEQKQGGRTEEQKEDQSPCRQDRQGIFSEKEAAAGCGQGFGDSMVRGREIVLDGPIYETGEEQRQQQSRDCDDRFAECAPEEPDDNRDEQPQADAGGIKERNQSDTECPAKYPVETVMPVEAVVEVARGHCQQQQYEALRKEIAAQHDGAACYAEQRHGQEATLCVEFGTDRIAPDEQSGPDQHEETCDKCGDGSAFTDKERVLPQRSTTCRCRPGKVRYADRTDKGGNDDQQKRECRYGQRLSDEIAKVHR